MFWIGFTVFIAVAVIIASMVIGVLSRMAERETTRANEERAKQGRLGGYVPDNSGEYLAAARAVKIGRGVAIGLWLAATGVSSIHQVDEREIGIVYTFGSITGQTEDGLVFIAPWQSLKTESVATRNRVFEGLTAASLETQDVYINAAMNYRVSPNAVQKLFSEVGPDWEEKLIDSRVQNFVKETTVQYRALEILNQREEVREKIEAKLKEELEPYSIEVEQFLLPNIDYTDAFNNAIEEKQVATQNALRAEEQVKIKEAEARQKVAEAKGEADSAIERARGEAERLRVEAQGQSDANALLTASLTPALIQYQAVQRLADNISIALIPSGQGIIIDPASIFQPQVGP